MADDEVADVADAGGEYGDIMYALEQVLEPEPKKEDPLASLRKHHPECMPIYAETVAAMVPLTASPPLGRDPNHKSPPFLTQFERTKIIGFRANQLSNGARPYIKKPEWVTDVGDIARMELEQRRLPFIIRRPMPNGSFEYWRLSDLLILTSSV
jgi:DNA-directed RNA polymerase I, II, and III subunit RPABC2